MCVWRSREGLQVVLQILFYRDGQHYIPIPKSFSNMILPLTPLTTQGLFLHPLELGQALWLPWPMEYSRGTSASSVSSPYCPGSSHFLLSGNAHSLEAPTRNPASCWEKPKTHGKFMQRCSGSWASIQQPASTAGHLCAMLGHRSSRAFI